MAQPRSKIPFPNELIGDVINNLDINEVNAEGRREDRAALLVLLRVSKPVWYLAAEALYTNLHISGDTMCALLLGGADTTEEGLAGPSDTIQPLSATAREEEAARSKLIKGRFAKGRKSYTRAHRFLRLPTPKWCEGTMDELRRAVRGIPPPRILRPDVHIPPTHRLSPRTRLALSFTKSLILRDMHDDAINVMRRSAMPEEPLFPSVTKIHLYATVDPYDFTWQPPSADKVHHVPGIHLFDKVDICAWQMESAAIAEYLSPRHIRTLNIHNDVMRPMASGFSFDHGVNPTVWTSDSLVHWFVQAKLEFDLLGPVPPPKDLDSPYARCWIGEEINRHDVPQPVPPVFGGAPGGAGPVGLAGMTWNAGAAVAAAASLGTLPSTTGIGAPVGAAPHHGINVLPTQNVGSQPFGAPGVVPGMFGPLGPAIPPGPPAAGTSQITVVANMFPGHTGPPAVFPPPPFPFFQQLQAVPHGPVMAGAAPIPPAPGNPPHVHAAAQFHPLPLLPPSVANAFPNLPQLLQTNLGNGPMVTNVINFAGHANPQIAVALHNPAQAGAAQPLPNTVPALPPMPPMPPMPMLPAGQLGNWPGVDTPEVVTTGDWKKGKSREGHQFRTDSKRFKHESCCVCRAKGTFEARDFGSVVFTEQW